MNQKNIATFLVLLASAIGAPVAMEHVQHLPEPAKVEIEGPTQVQVGELVRLSYDARDVSWIADSPDFQVTGNGTAVISFRKPGEYVITGAGKVADVVQLDRHTIFVGPSQPPSPDLPTPLPEPEKPDSQLRELVYGWCEESDVSKESARQVAENFITAASTTDTVDSLLEKTAQLNRSTDQGDVAVVLAKAQRYMIENLTGADFETHQCAWDDIAQGLIQWSQS